jgi:hypothetical protein
MLQVDWLLHEYVQRPAAQCELQVAVPPQVLWQGSPDGQLLSQLALPLQAWLQLDPVHTWLHVVVLPQVAVQLALF